MIEHIEKQWLSAYLDQQLGAAQQLRVQEHLASCVACRAYLLDLQQLQQDMRMLKTAGATIDVRAQTLALLPALTPSDLPSSERHSAWSLLEYGAAVASVICGVLIGSWMMPAEKNMPLDLAVVQVLGAEPPGFLCSTSAYCYLESKK